MTVEQQQAHEQCLAGMTAAVARARQQAEGEGGWQEPGADDVADYLAAASKATFPPELPVSGRITPALVPDETESGAADVSHV